MRTPTTIEALELAIDALKYTWGGGAYSGEERRDILCQLDRARDAHREQELKDEQRRIGIRALAAQRRVW